MENINTFTCEARLTKEPEFKQIDGLKGFINFQVALNTSKKKAGVYEDYTNYLNVRYFSSKKVSDMLEKGMRVFITGKLEQERWESKEGVKREKIVIIARQISMVFKNDKPKQAYNSDGVTNDDSDIPF